MLRADASGVAVNSRMRAGPDAAALNSAWAAAL
jgi:hypothetical protein